MRFVDDFDGFGRIEEGLVVTDASKITTRKKASGATGAGDGGVEDDVIVYGEDLVA